MSRYNDDTASYYDHLMNEIEPEVEKIYKGLFTEANKHIAELKILALKTALEMKLLVSSSNRIRP